MTGSGTLLDPYIISTVDDLQAMESDLDAYYELGGDIDASATSGWNAGAGFLPIGQSSPYFIGHFDGKGYSITNLTINRPTESFVGLFSDVEVSASIKNVSLTGTVAGRTDVGALIGYIWGDSVDKVVISNCHSSCSVVGRYNVGGLIGETTNTEISDCSATENIIAYTSAPRTGNYEADFVGGFVGSTYGTTIIRCSATGNIICAPGGQGATATATTVNGVVTAIQVTNGGSGYVASTTVISITGQLGHGSGAVGEAVISGGVITGITVTNGGSGYDLAVYVAVKTAYSYSIGGFVGGTSGDTIDQCFATGNITGNGLFYNGGFVGYNVASISNCYARGAIETLTDGGGFVGENDYNNIIDNCYSTGLITDNGNDHSDIGGFCGIGSTGISDCFWDFNTSGTATSDGGTWLTTAQMKTEANFTGAGWNFTTIWDIDGVLNDGYPWLIDNPPFAPSGRSYGFIVG